MLGKDVYMIHLQEENQLRIPLLMCRLQINVRCLWLHYQKLTLHLY